MTGDPRRSGDNGDDEPTRAAGGDDAQTRTTGGDDGQTASRAGQAHRPPPDASHQDAAGWNPKHVVLAGVIVLVVVAGALFLLGGGSGPGGPGATDGGAQSSPTGMNDGDGAAKSSLTSAVASEEDVNRVWDNYTLQIDSTVVDPSGTLVSNQTIRVDAVDNRTLGTTRTTLDDGSSMTIHREFYASNGTAYVMRRFAGSENRTFTRETEANRPAADLESLEERFDFEHSRTADGDHRYTAESVEQYTGERFSEGTLEAAEADIVVDEETGVVLSARFRLEATRSGERYVMATARTLTERGETTVTPPSWLATAKNRTSR